MLQNDVEKGQTLFHIITFFSGPGDSKNRHTGGENLAA